MFLVGLWNCGTLKSGVLMTRRLQFVLYAVLGGAGAVSCAAQAPRDIHSPKHRAWDLLITAVLSNKTEARTNGIRAMGLLEGDQQAREFAEHALEDPKPEVRRAAATALGKMHATLSVPKLEQALSDKKVPVVMAAAQSLSELNDEKAAYEVYYELLMRERKTGDGVIAEELETLKNPKELAKIGLSQGIGYIPFAGIGWDAYRTLHKKDPNPVRAVAAKLLAEDPDPASARALVKATGDKNWIVRAAAVEAIAERGDSSLLSSIVTRCSDRNENVRFTAAAAVIRLSALEQTRTAKNQ